MSTAGTEPNETCLEYLQDSTKEPIEHLMT